MAQAWAQAEQAHCFLLQISGEKTRRWGKKLKDTWLQNAKNWQEEMEQLIQKIRAERERETTIARIVQQAAEATARREKALEQGRLADQEEKNQIGEMLDSIASKLELIQKHLAKAKKAYEEGDQLTGQECERKVAILEGRILPLEKHLEFLKTEMETWKRDYQTETSRYLETQEEVQPDGIKIRKSIYKGSFVGELIRIEEKIYPDGHAATAKMSAEYLMVELKPGTEVRDFVELIKRHFPNNALKVEEVLPQRLLYSFYFNASEDKPSLLDLLTEIKKQSKRNN